MKNIQDVVKYDLCLGCGLCALKPFPNQDSVKMKYSTIKGHIIPEYDIDNSENIKIGFEICPGKGYKIQTLAKNYGLGEFYDKDLGYYNKVFALQSKEKRFSEHASSSGIMSQLCMYMMNEGIIDSIIVTKFVYTENGPIAKAFIANTEDDLISAQGSKYCPVDFSEVINEIINCDKKIKFAFIGTPCQIAAVRQIQDKFMNIGIQYFIGNFCGGFKSYNNLRRIIKMHGFKLNSVTNFRFRGGGQPGSMSISSVNKCLSVNYPEYVKMTGYSKLKRCHLCVDATAELADFSCGDAWIKEYLDKGVPTSIVITRTKTATDILNEMGDRNHISLTDIDIDTVINSQLGNITTKKYRQYGRLKLYNLLGIKVPFIYEGFHKGSISWSTEINVFLSHKIKFIFEKIRFFVFFYYESNFFKRVMFKLFKDNFN